MPWTLYYDGGCNLCHASQSRAARWARRSAFPLNVEVLQSPEAVAKGYGNMMVLETDHGVFQGAEAWLEIMRFAPGPLKAVSWLRLTAPTRWLAGLLYSTVARLRYALFGRRACPVPGAK